jgi:hypothetical protein
VLADRNTLNHLKVSWRTELIWNICGIWYFLSVLNSNKLCSNETLVCIVIRTSDPWDCRRASYQLSCTSLIIILIAQYFCKFIKIYHEGSDLYYSKWLQWPMILAAYFSPGTFLGKLDCLIQIMTLNNKLQLSTTSNSWKVKKGQNSIIRLSNGYCNYLAQS